MFQVHLEGPTFCVARRRQHHLLKVALPRAVTARVLTFRGEKPPASGSFLLLFMGSWAPAVAAAAAKSLQSCLTLCDPIDCSPVPGILQARTLEWDAISSSSA